VRDAFTAAAAACGALMQAANQCPANDVMGSPQSLHSDVTPNDAFTLYWSDQPMDAIL